MFDFGVARQTQPCAELPRAAAYPDGAARFAAHVDRAFIEHEARFGVPPTGTWPAEGALSPSVIDALAARGSRWAASGEAVLMNSLRLGAVEGPDRAAALYQPYRMEGVAGLQLFFRDDRLSDLIGFDYSRRHSGEAAAQFVSELEAIAASWTGDVPPVVSVMLDGENAWEHFPYNGHYFLDELYRRLSSHPVIRPTTFEALIARDVVAEPLPALCAGSWVYGDLATWIGAPEKNRAWDLLVDARAAYLQVVATLPEAQRSEATRRLSICEGSDWFWWFGDYNPQQTIASFDSLFRLHLTRLYESLGLPAPGSLSERIHGESTGGEAEGGGAMRRSSAG